MKHVFFVLLLSSLPASAAAQECFRDHIGLDPVQPTLTLDQWNAGLAAASGIVPRLKDGTASASGRIYFLSIGMSNTVHVFKGFIGAAKSSGVLSPNVTLVNGAISGKTATEWANPNDSAWTRLIDQKLINNMHVYPAAIAAVFIMVTNRVGKLPLTPAENAEIFKANVRAIRQNLDAKGFTNRKIDYITNNYYGGYDVGQNNIPEPKTYYEGLTLQQLQDEAAGPVWVSAASTYLWADGVRPRPWDGLTLLCEDIQDDGVHLTNTIGVPKYGRHLFDALRADPTTYGWLW